MCARSTLLLLSQTQPSEHSLSATQPKRPLVDADSVPLSSPRHSSHYLHHGNHATSMLSALHARRAHFPYFPHFRRTALLSIVAHTPEWLKKHWRPAEKLGSNNFYFQQILCKSQKNFIINLKVSNVEWFIRSANAFDEWRSAVQIECAHSFWLLKSTTNSGLAQSRSFNAVWVHRKRVTVWHVKNSADRRSPSCDRLYRTDGAPLGRT